MDKLVMDAAPRKTNVICCIAIITTTIFISVGPGGMSPAITSSLAIEAGGDLEPYLKGETHKKIEVEKS